MQVNVRHRGLHVQADPHRADHLQIGGLGIAGEGENVRSGFEAAVVGGAGSQTDGGTCDGRGRVRRVIAKPAWVAGGGWVGAEPADPNADTVRWHGSAAASRAGRSSGGNQ